MRSKYKAFLNKEDISHLYNTLTVGNKYYVLKEKNNWAWVRLDLVI